MLMNDRDQGERVTTLASCTNVFEKQKTACNQDFSLSRREDSSKNKLFACLLVCSHSTDGSKQQCENKTDDFLKTLSKANRR